MKRPVPLIIAAAALVALGAGLAWGFFLLSLPGPLSRAHADLELEKQCLKCHLPFQRPANKACLDCHPEIAALMDSGGDVHAAGWRACYACHAEHRGREASIIPTPEATATPIPLATPLTTPAVIVREAGLVAAVDLVGAWVAAGVPSETEPFEFVGLDGRTYLATFADDIVPLFDKPNLWFDGAKECANCHTAKLSDADAELDMTSYQGIMAGSYRLSNPPGTPIIIPGDWQASPLRDRLMLNRMPIRGVADTEAADDAERDGPEVEAGGGKILAVNLIGAWVAAGAPGAAEPFQFTGLDGQTYSTTYAEGIEPLFAARDLWHHDTKSCLRCHDSDLANSDAELDMSSVEGILAGSYRLSQAPGVPIIVPGDWEHSPLHDRLRNNRMPVDTPPDAPPEGPVVEAGQLK